MAQSIHYICCTSACWGHTPGGGGALQSPSLLSACLIDAQATTGSLTDCWMNIPLIDVTHNWPDVPASPRFLPPPLSHSRTQGIRCMYLVWCITAATQETNFRTSGLRLVQQTGWHLQQIYADASKTGRDIFAPVDILSSNRALRK